MIRRIVDRSGGFLRWLTSTVVVAVILPGPTAAAQSAATDLKGPRTVAVDEAGGVLVTDTENHRIVRIDPSGAMTVIAGTGKPGSDGDGGPATAARLEDPHGIAVDSAGNIYVADSPNHRIRRIDPAGIITTVAGTGSAPRATAARRPPPVSPIPRDVALDHGGNLYVADTTAHRIRRIDRHGDLFTADSSNNRVRWVDRAGTIRTLFGTGERKDAPGAMGLADPRGLNTDHAGGVFVADTGNNRVLRVR